MEMPARRSRSAVAGPTPGITVTCIGRSRSSSVPAATTTSPSGLSRSEATLATNFEDATPTDAVSPPVTSVTRARTCSASARTDVLVVRREPGDGEIDERLVERERLDQGRDRSRRTAITCLAGVAVGVETRVEERRVGAAGPRLAGRHRRAHAVATGLVGRGGRRPRARPRRRPRPACRAATACRAARRRRRRRRGPGASPTRPDACGATYRRPPTVRRGAPDRPLTVHSVILGQLRSTGCRRTRGSASAPPGTVAPMTTTLTARRPEDLLAAVPVVLGFRPARLPRHAHLRRGARASTPASTCRRPPRCESACCRSSSTRC